jgi:hypothetical protein
MRAPSVSPGSGKSVLLAKTVAGQSANHALGGMGIVERARHAMRLGIPGRASSGHERKYGPVKKRVKR